MLDPNEVQDADAGSDDAYRYSQKELLEVALVGSVTFNAWRSRHGLFPRTRADRKWNYYRLEEVIAARALVVMRNAGMTTSMAIEAAMALVPMLDEITGDVGKASSAVAVYVRPESSPAESGVWKPLERGDSLNDLMCATEVAPGSFVLNLGSVVSEVMAALFKATTGNSELFDAMGVMPDESFTLEAGVSGLDGSGRRSDGA